MQVRRSVGAREIEKQERDDFGTTRFRYLSAQDTRLPKNANDQGIVLKLEQCSPDLIGANNKGSGGATKAPGHQQDSGRWP